MGWEEWGWGGKKKNWQNTTSKCGSRTDTPVCPSHLLSHTCMHGALHMHVSHAGFVAAHFVMNIPRWSDSSLRLRRVAFVCNWVIRKIVCCFSCSFGVVNDQRRTLYHPQILHHEWIVGTVRFCEMFRVSTFHTHHLYWWAYFLIWTVARQFSRQLPSSRTLLKAYLRPLFGAISHGTKGVIFRPDIL